MRLARQAGSAPPRSPIRAESDIAEITTSWVTRNANACSVNVDQFVGGIGTSSGSQDRYALGLEVARRFDMLKT